MLGASQQAEGPLISADGATPHFYNIFIYIVAYFAWILGSAVLLVRLPHVAKGNSVSETSNAVYMFYSLFMSPVK